MKLSFEQIKSITKGAARIVMDNGKVRFLRFTEEQEKMYEEFPDFLRKTFATSGVRLEFKTNSRSLSLKVDVSGSSSRTFFSHDICVNGELRYALAADVASSPDKHVTAEGSYALGDGKKTVFIYFPWSVDSELISLEIDNGATLAPVTHSRKILVCGESITHVYDASRTSYSYAARLVDALDAEGCNKGIGGELFRSPLAAMKDNYAPDIITVAYGTNDWAHGDRERYVRESRGFYENLVKSYPDAKIFALAPIWRGDITGETGVGPFEFLAENLRNIAKDIPNMTVIDCIDFVPHSPSMFSPDILHPNDQGFDHYAEGVIKAIKKELNI